jgi:hypothetical protein
LHYFYSFPVPKQSYLLWVPSCLCLLLFFLFCSPFYLSRWGIYPLCPRVRCLLAQQQAKMKITIASFFAAWTRILLTFHYWCASWVQANFMIETSCCFQRCNRNSGCRFLYKLFPQTFDQAVVYLSTHAIMRKLMKLVGSNGSQSLPISMKWMVWYFASETLTRLLPHSFFLCLFCLFPCFCWMDTVVTFYLSLWRFLCNLIDMNLLQLPNPSCLSSEEFKWKL